MAAEEFNPQDPVTSFPEVWKRVVIEPRAFFAALPAAGGLQPPLAFAAVCFAIGGVEILVFGGGLKGLVGFVLVALVRLFFGAAVFVLIAQSLFEGRGDYEATFRALAYASAMAALIGIPLIKYFAALYGIYLAILGLEKAHAFDSVRAILCLAATVFTLLVAVHALGLGGMVHRHSPLLH